MCVIGAQIAYIATSAKQRRYSSTISLKRTAVGDGEGEGGSAMAANAAGEGGR